jgi:uncharacterized membrane protein (UPF0182 family)
VIVGAAERIAMGPTLEASLTRLFGESPSGGPKAPTPEPKPGEPSAAPLAAAPSQTAAPAGSKVELSIQAKQHYDRATQAQRDGDWARYGEEMKKLGEVLNQMPKQQ